MMGFLNVVVLGAFVAAGPQSVDDREIAIARFFEVVGSSNATIQDFFELFGEGNEAEIGTTILVHFPGIKEPHRDPKVIRFVNDRLARPRQYRSEFLRCLSAARPAWRPHVALTIRSVPGRSKEVEEYQVEVAGEVLTFIFRRGSRTIMHVLVDGADTFGGLVLRCRPPPSGSPIEKGRP